jgi:CheY-like chemotaxis protein
VEEALKKAKQESEEANRTKSQFMANMSHELRTPLNSVIGFANILLKNKSGKLEPKEEGFLERIQANGKHLLSLINEILDLSKIEAGKMELEIESIDLSQLVRETLAQLEGQVAGKPVLPLGDFPENLAPLLADPGKLRQVIINLVGNALKYTESGEVIVRVEGTPGRGVAERILVRDTGVGIPPDRLEAVFEAFQQADGSTTRRFGGTGLGLTISRSLCQLMGYRITIESTVGVGSTFTIHLATPPASGESAAGADLEVASDARWTPALLDPTQDLKGKRILVVDDEADSRTLLQHLLEDFGCTVYTAVDGIAGIEEARRRRPDLITVDLMMPRMNGWDMLRVLRDDAILRKTPAVVVSIIPEEGTTQTLGEVDIVSKPVERDELIFTLRRHLSASVGRVLIVDDNPDTRSILQRYLRDAGLTVHTATNGEAALDFLRRSQVDLILLDLLMPGMDGFATLDRLRRGGLTRRIPVVVLTAKELSQAERSRLSEHADGVILKDADVERRLGELFERYFGEGKAGALPESRR